MITLTLPEIIAAVLVVALLIIGLLCLFVPSIRPGAVIDRYRDREKSKTEIQRSETATPDVEVREVYQVYDAKSKTDFVHSGTRAKKDCLVRVWPDTEPLRVPKGQTIPYPQKPDAPAPTTPRLTEPRSEEPAATDTVIRDEAFLRDSGSGPETVPPRPESAYSAEVAPDSRWSNAAVSNVLRDPETGRDIVCQVQVVGVSGIRYRKFAANASQGDKRWVENARINVRPRDRIAFRHVVENALVHPVAGSELTYEDQLNGATIIPGTIQVFLNGRQVNKEIEILAHHYFDCDTVGKLLALSGVDDDKQVIDPGQSLQVVYLVKPDGSAASYSSEPVVPTPRG